MRYSSLGPLVVLLTACYSETNDDPPGDGSGQSSTGDDTGTATTPGDTTSGAVDMTTGPGECPPQDTVPKPPADWSGPFVLMSSAPDLEPPMCPQGLADDGVANAGPAASDCACDCAVGCVLSFFAAAGCDGPPSQLLLTPACMDPDATGSVGEPATNPNTTDCASPTAGPSTLTWEQRLRSCRGGPADDCVPAPEGAIGPCIRHEGDAACPSPEQVRIVTHADGTTTCDTCPSCDALEERTCAAMTITGYTDAACSETPTTFAAIDCSPVTIRSLTTELPEMVCPPVTGEVAELTDTRTYCCAP